MDLGSCMYWQCDVPVAYAGDTRHFDMSWSAFGAIASHEKGVIDLEYTQVPRALCQKDLGQLGVNMDTCNDYHGVLVSKDLWKLFVGVAVCFVVAALVCFVFVQSLYGLRRRQS